MPNSIEALRDRAARLAADPSLRPHGHPGTYSNWGCRCVPCSQAHTKYARELRERAAANDFRDPIPSDRDERREKLRAMGFEVIEGTEDVI